LCAGSVSSDVHCVCARRYDGHTGKLAAEYTRTQLHANVARHPEFATDLRKAISDAFIITDRDFNLHAKRIGLKDGCTG
jgi:hypothetical protein